MGTYLIDNGSLILKRFWGGDERGQMFAISKGKGRYIELTEAEIKEIYKAIMESTHD